MSILWIRFAFFFFCHLHILHFLRNVTWELSLPLGSTAISITRTKSLDVKSISLIQTAKAMLSNWSYSWPQWSSLQIKHQFFFFKSCCPFSLTRTFMSVKWKLKSLSHVQLFVTLWAIGIGNSPSQNIEVGSLSLLQGIFSTQGSNLGLPHCRWILYQLSHQGSPRILEWVA